MVTERQTSRTCLKLYNKKFILGGSSRIHTVAGVHIILQFIVAWDFCLGLLLVSLWTCEEENPVKPQSKICATSQLCQNCSERQKGFSLMLDSRIFFQVKCSNCGSNSI